MSHPLTLRRFVGGRLNMCYNAVDRHVEAGQGEQRAVVWDSAITGSKSTITYAQLREFACCSHVSLPRLGSILATVSKVTEDTAPLVSASVS